MLDEHLETEPFLVRISAAKRLRDRAERDMRQAGEDRVTVERVAPARWPTGCRHERPAAAYPASAAGTQVPADAFDRNAAPWLRPVTAIPVARDGRGNGRKAITGESTEWL